MSRNRRTSDHHPLVVVILIYGYEDLVIRMSPNLHVVSRRMAERWSSEEMDFVRKRLGLN